MTSRRTVHCTCKRTMLADPGPRCASVTYCGLCDDQLLAYGAGYRDPNVKVSNHPQFRVVRGVRAQHVGEVGREAN